MIAHHTNHIPCDGKEKEIHCSGTVQAAGRILSVPCSAGVAAVVLGRKAFSLKGCKVYSPSQCVTVLHNPVGHSYGKCFLEDLVNIFCHVRID